mgnify:CR=1 FL=1
MRKTTQLCPKCHKPLIFRDWSKRYPKGSRYREALADCHYGCGKFGLRFFDGVPTCEPYQVKPPAKKTETGSYKLTKERKAAICALYGSPQRLLDTIPLVGITVQYKP